MTDHEPAARSVSTCFYHTDRETGRRCTRCGRPACSECLRQAQVGAHCFQCVRDTQTPTAERRRVQRALAAGDPKVTKVLIGINVVAYVYAVTQGAELSPGRRFMFDWSLLGPFIDVQDEWWRLVTSGFLHWSLLHLGMNMLALWILGRAVEPSLGSAAFTGLYFASLLGGSFGALLVEPFAQTAGASGAIYGLFGAIAAAYWRQGINPLRTEIGAILLLNLLITLTVPNISIGGHVGGLVAGGIIGLAQYGRHRTELTIRIGVPVAVSIVSVIGGLWAATTWTNPIF